MRRDATTQLRAVMRRLGGATRTLSAVERNLRKAFAVPGQKRIVHEAAEELRLAADRLDKLALTHQRMARRPQDWGTRDWR